MNISMQCGNIVFHGRMLSIRGYPVLLSTILAQKANDCTFSVSTDLLIGAELKLF